MKNWLLTLFVTLLIFINIAYFDLISIFFMGVSDVLYSFTSIDVGCIILGVLFVIAFVVLLIHFLLKRDKHETVEVVGFKCPDDLTPVELGFLVDGIVDSEDISSLLVYWASKKYIDISNDKDQKNQKLIKIVEKLPDTAKDYEKKLFETIFRNDKEILVSTISSRLENSTVVPQAISTVQKEVGKKYFNNSALLARQIFIVVFAFLFYVSAMYFRLEYYVDIYPIVESFAIASTALYVIVAMWNLKYYDYRHKGNTKKGKIASNIFLILMSVIMAGLSCYFYWTDIYLVIFLVCVSVLLYFVVFMVRNLQIYSPEGQKKLGEVLGFKNFIEVAEKDRIIMLVEENPEIYYNVLPYAYVLGVSDKWIKNLEVIKARSVAIDDRMATRVIVTSRFVSSTRNNFHHLVKRSYAMASSRGGHGSVHLGASRGGGHRGGSNHGGIRRR